MCSKSLLRCPRAHVGPGAEAVVLDYNWRRYQRVVDIGGAYGSFLARFLRHNTKATGVLFDQPQVPVHSIALGALVHSTKRTGASCQSPPRP